MTKGKHGNKAANREQAALQREVPLRNEIVRLKTKLEKADRALAEQSEAHVKETSKMREIIAANTSERLIETEAKVAEVTGERDEARAEVDAIQRRWNSISSKIVDHFQGSLGMDYETSMRTLILWSGVDMDENFALVLDEDHIAQRKFGTTGMQAIRRARRTKGDYGQGFTVGR